MILRCFFQHERHCVNCSLLLDEEVFACVSIHTASNVPGQSLCGLLRVEAARNTSAYDIRCFSDLFVLFFLMFLSIVYRLFLDDPV